MRTVPQKPGLGYEGWVAGIKKRLLRSFLTNGNLENFIGKVKDVANSRCLCGYDYFIIDQRGNVGYGVLHILREASASLLVLLYRAVPEPPFV